ncbi:MAG TPA: pirin family protein [Gammaproteobacteria bacterium]|nr:pirin family protein [Gammaproteobacteria bacterium]
MGKTTDRRTIAQCVPSLAVTEGAGVTVHRSIGTPALHHLDPFLMLDYFNSDRPDEYIAGFPEHPHRGFNTFTYMLDGCMQHGDSMGNTGNLGPGDAQWMKAGSGVIHSEMPRQEDGLLRGFQLWVNLPAVEKMSPPAYQEVAAEDIPEVVREGVRVRVLLGEYADQQGPVQDAHTEVVYLDVTLSPGVSFDYDGIAEGATVFVYLFEGAAAVAGEHLAQHQLAVLAEGTVVNVTAGGSAARFLLVAGQPIGEPIVQQGPFVMNTHGEIKQAMSDYHHGRLVQERRITPSEDQS